MGEYEILEHTADVGVRARGRTVEEVFEQATLGLVEVVGALRPDAEHPDAEGAAADQDEDQGQDVQVRVEAADLGGLLVDWLGEVLYLHDVRDAAVGSVRVEHVADGHASGTVRLLPVTDGVFEGTQVKAVTYHRLRVEPEGDGWVAEVYLDV
jgi:SHS2 domain-containing protein